MIYISVGHHQENPGACFQGFCEFNEAQIWAELINQNLPENESLIVPSGTLKEKVAYINKRKPLAAIEIHFNSAPVQLNVRGCETLYYPSSMRGERLAREAQAAMVSVGLHDRGIKPGYYQLNKNKGVDFFLEKTKCTSIIIEPEFIFNKDLLLEKREDVCIKLADSLKGALEWL